MRFGDSTAERLADRTATAGSPAARAEATARPVGLRGEQIMTNREDPAPFGAASAQVRSCWMCGIRLPASQMVADGGSACHDVRWYCRDTWGCTRRWTSHPARLTAIRPDVAGPLETPGEHSAGLVAASPLRSISPIISLPPLDHGVLYPVGMAIRGSPIYRSLASDSLADVLHSLAGCFRAVHPHVICATA
jgi:hypothetical protein